MSHTLALGLELLLFGLIGVFTTLIVFMVAITLLTKFFPWREDPSGEE